jgi:phosphoglycerate transport regulatory protein PgtC
VKFDVDVSEKRTAVVDALFDQLITFQLDALKGATKAIHDAEAALAKKDSPGGRALVKEARDLIAAMPVGDAEAASPAVTGTFTGAKEKGARQAEIEAQWAAFAKERYAQARAKADEATKLAR